MSAKKQYAAPVQYERKLEKVMERLGVKEYNYNWDRFGGWIEFRYKDQLYRFDHSVDQAKARGINLVYGSDAFAQLILSLEDLARMVERGIYDLRTWVAGMKYLPPAVEVPSFFKALGFTELPASEEEIKTRYKNLAKQLHPDVGGKEEDFRVLKEAAEQCLRYLGKVGHDVP